MPKEKRNKNKVPKITEEEYARYVSSLKEETPLATYEQNVEDRSEKKKQTSEKQQFVFWGCGAIGEGLRPFPFMLRNKTIAMRESKDGKCTVSLYSGGAGMERAVFSKSYKN